MKRSFVLLFHLGFWICYGIIVLIILVVYSRSFHSETEYVPKITNALKNLALFAIVPSIISYLIYSFVLFPNYLSQKKYFKAVLWGFIVSLTTGIIFYIIHRYLIEHGYVIDMDKGGKNGRSTAVTVILVSTFIGAISGIVAFVIKGFITWFEEVKLKEILREKNFEIEMALIRSQLDPHLLFNTINNIDALIIRDAESASLYLNKLSEIMRFILYETKTERISLSHELEYISKYIDLQKIRTANESYVNYSVTGDVGNRQIVPMIFIPFIENAFKHASNKKVQNAIKIDIFIGVDVIRFYCENKFDAAQTVKEVGGLGNELIERRLNLLYGDKHKLEVSKTNGLYSVSLIIGNG